MEGLSYPEDSCIRFWEDPSLDFSCCLDVEFSDLSESSMHLPPIPPLPSSFEEVGSPMLELDEPVLQKSDEGNPTEYCYNVYDGIVENSGTLHALVNSEANNVEDIDSYLDCDEKNSLTILLEPALSPVDQSVCTFCQLLREIIHADGTWVTKLQIHGRDGNICHALLLVQHSNGLEPAIQQEVIPFDVQNIESVKEFLLAYCRLRRQEGFIVLHDSLSAFYEAICAGISESEEPYPVSISQYQGDDLCSSPQADDFTSVVISTTILEDPLPQLVASVSPGRPPKSGIAAQRERTGRLQISDLVTYFHLPITVAAKELGICPTVLKKVCRRNGMRRWPHRKIKSIDRNLLNLERSLASGSREDVESIVAEIEKLRKERAQICSGGGAPT